MITNVVAISNSLCDVFKMTLGFAYIVVLHFFILLSLHQAASTIHQTVLP